MDPIAAALQVKLQAIVDAQLALNWTPPALRRSLQACVDAVAQVGATIELASPLGNNTPPRAGRATDALSLGVGVSASAALSISAGISLGVGISASASLLAQVTVGLHAAISATNDLERELATFNAQAEAVAGHRGVLRAGTKLEMGPVNRSLRRLNGKVADCQSKADAAAAAKPVSPIVAELRQPRMGAWACSLELDAEVAASGKLSFQLDDLEFVGTVQRDKSGLDGTRAKCRVIAGNGNINNEIAAFSYSATAGVTVGMVVRDILKDCGEDLSDLADKEALNKPLPRWHTQRGSASQALTLLAESSGYSWRMMRDGTVWFGEETWPEVEPAGTVVGGEWSAGVVLLASETPNMVPGTVFQGQRIEDVVHSYGVTLRTEIRTSSPRTALSGAFKRRQHEIDYSREYPCKVVTQNPDGTLQLLPDDEIMRARGLDAVPIRYGLPGFRAYLKPGARCHLAFAAGDPARPFAHNWESDADGVDRVVYIVNGREAPLARLGDPCTFFVTPGVPIPVSGTVSGAPFVGVMTIATPMVGAVNGGNPSLRG